MVGELSDLVRSKEAVFVKRLFIGWLALHILICVSVFVFHTIEGAHEQEHLNITKHAWKDADDFKAELKDRLTEGEINITSEDIEKVINLHISAESLGPKDDVKVKWTAIRTFSFTHEYLSTIGFGQVVPQTVAGKYLTVLLGYVGIPLYVFNVVMWGQVLKKMINRLLLPLYKHYKKKHSALHSEEIDMEELIVDQVPSNLLLAFFIGLFCLFFVLEVIYFVNHQNMEFHDSLYMTFAMVTSIGFGDFAPEYDEDVSTLVIVSLVQFLPFVLQSAIVGELVRKMEKGRRGWRFSNANTLEVIRKV